MTSLSASNENIGGEAGVVLRGHDWKAELTSYQARRLAQEIQANLPDLAIELIDAANSVDRFTGFDGPLGVPCDEIEERHGIYEWAKSKLFSIDIDQVRTN